MARRRKGRPVHGILLLDKPLGMTSNRILQQVKRIFDAQKAGHTGSLDPMATGLLPLCFGEATKVSGFLLDSNKAYLGTIKLGEVTQTADAEGEVIATQPVPELNTELINTVLASFTGKLMQVPPMHSAIKQNGQPLYKLAHQGLEVEREAREVHIHTLVCRGFTESTIDIEVHCSKGTYIRTLAEDIGNQLGCGGHLSVLRRTESGPFSLQNAVNMETIEQLAEQPEALDSHLLPIESALVDWPSVELTQDAAFYAKQGNPVLVPKAPTSGKVMLFAEQSGFFGVGEILEDGRVAPRRLFLH